MLHQEITQAIIQAFYKVYNTLGYGFLEKVYENALAYELTQQGLTVHQQWPIKVYYAGQLVGDYYADLLVADRVLVELKAAEAIAPAYEAQLLNYLKATEIEVGLLLNFGPKPEFRRKVFSAARRKNRTQIDADSADRRGLPQKEIRENPLDRRSSASHQAQEVEQ